MDALTIFFISASIATTAESTAARAAIRPRIAEDRPAIVLVRDYPRLKAYRRQWRARPEASSFYG